MSGISIAKRVCSYDLRRSVEWSSIDAIIEQPGGIARLDVNDKRHQGFLLQSCPQLITCLLTSSGAWAEFIVKNVDRIEPYIFKEAFNNAITEKHELIGLIGTDSTKQTIKLLKVLSPGNFEQIFLSNKPLAQFIMNHTDKFTDDAIIVAFSMALDRDSSLARLINPLNIDEVIRLLNNLSSNHIKLIFLHGERPLIQLIMDHMDSLWDDVFTKFWDGFELALDENSNLVHLINTNHVGRALQLLNGLLPNEYEQIFLRDRHLAQFIIDHINGFSSEHLMRGFYDALTEKPELFELITDHVDEVIRLLNKHKSDDYEKIFLQDGPLAQFIIDHIERFNSEHLMRGFSKALVEKPDLTHLITPKFVDRFIQLLSELSPSHFRQILLENGPLAQLVMEHINRFSGDDDVMGAFCEALLENPNLVYLISPGSVEQVIQLLSGLLSYHQVKEISLSNEPLTLFIMNHADRFDDYHLAKGFSKAVAEKPGLVRLINPDSVDNAIRLMSRFTSDQFKGIFLHHEPLAQLIMDHADRFNDYTLADGFSKALATKPELVRLINPESADNAMLLLEKLSPVHVKKIFFHHELLAQFIIGHVDHQHIRRLLKGFMEELFHDRAILETISRQYGFAIFGDLLTIYGISREQFGAITPGDFAALSRLYDSILRLTERFLAARGVSRDIIVPIEQRDELLRGIPTEAFPEEIQRIISQLEREFFFGQPRLTEEQSRLIKERFAHLRMIADAMYNGNVDPSHNYSLDGEEPIAFLDAFFAVEPDLRRGLKDYIGDLLVLVKLLEDSSFTQDLQPITAEEKQTILNELDVHVFRHCSPGWGEGIRERLYDVVKKRGLAHGDATCEELKADFHYNFVEGKLREALSLRNLGVHSLHAIVNRYGQSLGFTDGEITTARADPHHVSQFHFDAASTIFENLRSSITPQEVATFFKEHIMAEAYSNERARLLFQVCEALEAKGMLPYDPSEFDSHELWLATFYTQNIKDISKFPDALSNELCRMLGLLM